MIVSSSISKDLKKIIKKNTDIEIFSVGRNKESDYFCNFADYSSLMNFKFLNSRFILLEK